MGSRVGPYIVTTTIGQGTFGTVKLAKHTATGVEYAMKILDKSDIKANELTFNVRREIAIMKALNHRNIVNLREVLASKVKLYIVMDLVRGGELFDQIERRGLPDERVARKYFQQLVDGIDYCHRRGVCHRDLKPENLLVDENNTLKINDFGVSSMTGGASGSDLLYTVCGTPYYSAPEIIRGAVNGSEEGYVGVKIDAWSCGIILYLLLTGTLPFPSEDLPKLYEQITTSDVEYPHWMPVEACDLINHLLAKDPGARYSLEDVKSHRWFLVDYVETASDGSPLSGRHVRGGSSSSNGGRSSEGSSRGGSSTNSSRGNGQSRDKHLRGSSRARHSAEAMPPPVEPTQPSTSTPTHEQESVPVLRNVVAEYQDQDLNVLIAAALPGKPVKRIEAVVSKLENVDIECVEDIQFMAENLKTPLQLSTWLEKQCSLPSLTCMRIARFFFE